MTPEPTVAETLRPTIAEKLADLRREVQLREDDIATTLVLIDQARLHVSRMRDEIAGWEQLERWLPRLDEAAPDSHS